MAKAIVIGQDKSVREEDITELERYQHIVGGWVEQVTLSSGDAFFINEEGRYTPGLVFNSIATDVAGLGGRPDILLQGLIGNAVLVGPPDDEGETTDVTDEALAWVERVRGEA